MKVLLGVLCVITSAACAQGARVRPGIDVLLSDSLHLIAGKRVGLITNQTGVDANGVSSLDRLAAAHPTPHTPHRLVALFAPEHGIRGGAAPGERVADSVDAATNLPIYSLYDASRAPTPAELATLDVLVVDLQDVGARPFTYISTAIYAMRAVAAAGKRIIVLDRPNPIGCLMQGPVLDSANASFIGMLPIPLRHGLTMAELARFANAELEIRADLVVVPVQGWRRCQWFDETGLPWVRPSPNLPDLASLMWYPGTVLFEATNLSVGRGTDAAFRQLGAPWLRPEPIVDQLPLSLHAGASVFTPERPGDGKYPGVTLPAVSLRPMQAGRRTADVVEYALWLMMAAARAHPDSFRADSAGLARRLGVAFDPALAAAQCRGTWERCRWTWDREIADFRRRIRPYLLY